MAPISEQFIVFRGNPDAGRFVEWIAFQGLKFLYGACRLEAGGHCDMQAAVNVPATIQGDGVRHCKIDSCELAHFGTYGIWLRHGAKHNRIVGNHIHDMGAGAVRLGECGNPPTENTETDHNVISNNYIHGAGQVYAGAVGGVWVGQASDNQIAHNEICDTTWEAISLGWSWGFGPTKAHRNEVGFNHIHHVGRWLQPDCGAIYTLGLSPGTWIHHNPHPRRDLRRHLSRRRQLRSRDREQSGPRRAPRRTHGALRPQNSRAEQHLRLRLERADPHGPSRHEVQHETLRQYCLLRTRQPVYAGKRHRG